MPSQPALPASHQDTPWTLPEAFGRYLVRQRLGAGGAGSVYLAHDTVLDRRVALKVPHFPHGSGPEVLQRFLREAQLAARLDHPNICRVYDVGQINGVHYLAMAYVEGQPLARRIDPAKPMPGRELASLVRKLALALQEAHAQGVIHRDLKPSNVMIDRHGEPVIMDFGLAFSQQSQDERLTASGLPLGTPAYMPPEQADGDLQAIGPHSDVYSLGVILYELLTGRLPFTQQVLKKVRSEEPPRPSAVRPEVDPVLEAICLKAMAKKPEARYASMAELAAALGDWLGTEEPAISLARTDARLLKTLLPDTTPPAQEGPTPCLPVPSWQAPQATRRWLRPLLWLVLAAAAAAAVAVAVVLEVNAHASRQRWLALAARQEAAEARQQAEQELARWAATEWDEAKRQDQQAQEAFDAGDVAGALRAWQAARSGYQKAQEAAGEIDNSIGMRLVRVPAGHFSMGSTKDEAGRDPNEGPVHKVEISRTFYLGKFEVTQEQYWEVMRKNPSYFCSTGKGRDAVQDLDTRQLPVDSVSWENAVEFCRRLSGRLEEKRVGRKYRLPTEAEWEYACRAGTSTPFHFGTHCEGSQANCDAAGLKRTCRVGFYPPNAWGLFDMHGNVWEWCHDWYDKDYYRHSEKKDPRGPAEERDQHVLRGGSWHNTAAFCRAAVRYSFAEPPYMGLRVALDRAPVNAD
jgi:formylglycine-generating enzyme required for sulfatase activity